MKNIDTINQFISLRACGFTYNEIQEEIDVSKPTLIKWNKKYEDDIERVSRYIFSKLFAFSLIENKNQIILNTDILIKYNKDEFNGLLEKKNYNRAIDYLENKFLKEIKSINFTLTKYGKIREVTYNFIDDL